MQQNTTESTELNQSNQQTCVTTCDGHGGELPNVDREYLDVTLLDPDRIMKYKKWVDNGDDTQSMLSTKGMLSAEEGKYHKYCGFNKFSKETYPIPPKNEGWNNQFDEILEEYKDECEEREKYKDHYAQKGKAMKTLEEYMEKNLKYHIKYVIESMCDPSAKIFQPSQTKLVDRHQGFKMYKTLDNYGIGFVVFVGKDKGENDMGVDTVYVYGRTTDLITDEERYDELDIFVNLIKCYKTLEVWIGTSSENEMTRYSGGYGDKWDGNSILLRIENVPEGENVLQENRTNGFRYVHIGIDMFEFVTDQPVIKYISSVGNNCVPYPYAETQDWCYCMLNCTKSLTQYHKDRELKGEVFENDGAVYEHCDVVHVAERNTDVSRYPADCEDDYMNDDTSDNYLTEDAPEGPECAHECICSKKPRVVRFTQPTQVTLMQNTCSDESLPAVQCVNNIFNHTDPDKTVSTYSHVPLINTC